MCDIFSLSINARKTRGKYQVQVTAWSSSIYALTTWKHKVDDPGQLTSVLQIKVSPYTIFFLAYIKKGEFIPKMFYIKNNLPLVW